MVRNPNRDDLSKIKNWLSKREVEDPIPSKSKDRVHTSMARQIRQIKPLPVGGCHICGFHRESLVPMVLKCCLNCCKSFIKKSGGLRVRQRHVGRHYCDKCLMLTYISFTVNPLVCPNCVGKIGKKHKYELVDYRRQKQADDLKLKKHGGIL